MSRSKNTLPARRTISGVPLATLRYPRTVDRKLVPERLLLDPVPPRAFLRVWVSRSAVNRIRRIHERQARAKTRQALQAVANLAADDVDEIDIPPTRHRGSAVYEAW